MQYCLPKYSFRLLDDTGWNFRFANYHEENRRTLVKAYGIKFLLNVGGLAGKFNLKNTVILLVTGLGLLGLSNILCDLALLHCSPRIQEEVMRKKFETVRQEDDKQILMDNLKALLKEKDGPSLSTMMMNSALLVTTPDAKKAEDTAATMSSNCADIDDV